MACIDSVGVGRRGRKLITQAGNDAGRRSLNAATTEVVKACTPCSDKSNDRIRRIMHGDRVFYVHLPIELG